MTHFREQDLFETKVLLGDSKAKVGLSFMYDQPAGLKEVRRGIDTLTTLKPPLSNKNQNIILEKKNQNINLNGKRMHREKNI